MIAGPRIRVMLVEDHALVRAGLRRLLEESPGVEVVAEAGEGREALRILQDRQVDVLLVDVALPGLNGLEVCREVARGTDCRVLVVSMHANEEYVLRALENGAQGYLLKDASADELEAAVRSAYRGEIYLSPAVSREVIEAYRQRVGDREEPLDLLTPRQREVLQLVAEGYTTKEIAARLFLSVKTVESHRANIMDRLGIRDLAGLVRFAVENELVIPTE